MAGKPSVLELGPGGIINEPKALIRKLFVQAFLANKSQSVNLKEKVFSIQWVASIYGSNPIELSAQLQKELTSYYGRYFPEGVKANVTERDPGQKVKYGLDIAINVTHEGKTYSLHESLYRDNNSDVTQLLNAIQ